MNHAAVKPTQAAYITPDQAPTDFTLRQLKHALRQATVSDLMTHGALCLNADTSLGDAANALMDLRIGAMPVVDDSDPPIGMVELRDVLEHYRAAHTRGRGSPEAATARDIMRPISLSFDPSVPADFAAAVLAYQHVSHVPIVSRDGKLCGMLASEDVLRWVSWASGYVMPDMIDRTAQRLSHSH